MATELSMNGKKKIETIQKEFSVKFPYLTLIFLDKERIILDIAKTLAEVRQSKGDDVSIVASLKVNTLEKKFLTNYGLIVEVAFQKDGQVVMTEPDEQKTLNELNSWCEANGCNKIDYKKSKELAFSEDFIDKAIAENNAHEDGFDIEFNEVNIGNQIWMLKNLNIDKFRNGDPIPYVETQEQWMEASKKKQPACCNYNNDADSGKKYGKLYNWYAVNDSRGLAPDGWHIPSENEWSTLFSLIVEDDEVNDFKLKCDVSWGLDSDGTNQTGFTALPSGYRNELEGFIGMYNENNPEASYAAWWSSTDSNPNSAYYRAIEYEYDGDQIWESEKGAGFSVRCIKNISTDNVKNNEDIEVKIGDQTWMGSNLNVSNFSNGDPIFEAKSPDEWIKANKEKKPAFCHYKFDSNNEKNYSKYYNWYAVIDKRGLAPTGWEIPTIESFDQLFKSIDAKTKLSSGDDFSTWDGLISPALKSTEIWEYEEPTNNDPDAAGTNTSGFNMLGLGFIDNVGIFQLFMEQTYLWVNNPENDNENKSVIFDMSYTGILLGMQTDINNGCQIRCIKKNIQELLNIDPVLEIVKNKLLEYNNEIIVNPYLSPSSLSFKLPFISNNDSSKLIISVFNENYQMQFECFDKNLNEDLIAFKPDVIKKYSSGVKKDDLCKNEGDLLSSVVDFICLLNRKSLDFGDGTQIYYVGYNKYSKSINGVGQFQVFKGKEANIFSNYDNYEIETQKWMTRNLQTSFFRNGELIKEAKTQQEWLLAAENKTPAWCYYNNDPANGSKYGYLYNWYAINDPRGLAPKGWEIPNQQDYLTFLENLKSRNSGVDFNLTPAGYRLQDSTFNLINQVGFWWTKDEKDENARFASFAIDKPELIFGDGLKTLGLSVICIAESTISQSLQELIDAGIAVNLYRNTKMYEDDIYFSESDLKSNIKTYGSMFLDHLFAIPFKSYNNDVVDKVFKFLDKQIKVNYKDIMFIPSMHKPCIGIYNAKSNELLGVGIGRKNRIFIKSTDKTIDDQNYRTFSKFDHLNVIGTIVDFLTAAADAQIDIMDAIDDGDSASEAEYSESLDDAIDNLLIIYPNLPNSIGDLSPGDF